MTITIKGIVFAVAGAGASFRPIIAIAALAGLALAASATPSPAMPDDTARDKLQDRHANRSKVERVCGQRRKYVCYNPQNPSTCTYAIVRDC